MGLSKMRTGLLEEARRQKASSLSHLQWLLVFQKDRHCCWLLCGVGNAAFFSHLPNVPPLPPPPSTNTNTDGEAAEKRQSLPHHLLPSPGSLPRPEMPPGKGIQGRCAVRGHGIMSAGRGNMLSRGMGKARHERMGPGREHRPSLPSFLPVSRPQQKCHCQQSK